MSSLFFLLVDNLLLLKSVVNIQNKQQNFYLLLYSHTCTYYYIHPYFAEKKYTYDSDAQTRPCVGAAFPQPLYILTAAEASERKRRRVDSAGDEAKLCPDEVEESF